MPKPLKLLIVATCCSTAGLILNIVDAGLSPLVLLMSFFWAVMATTTIWLVIKDRRRPT
ncbi:hypothetical protein [Streptomyces bauhiniae]|uniref:Uncharacterized protein n=1 Tax=Streptomyces bauhiniae TaxID=2340725 RepID=A0A7K3QWE9_9ACTN|nr:hypothetical protein [Streptomyces bauhiniae]NEB94244.1 hypothetical protein [Streptomyces bauhiniae]